MIEVNAEKENQEIARRYKEMLRKTYRHIDEDGVKLIRRALDLAVDAHKEQRRKSGEPYIYHPLEVANIVANEIGLGATSIAAALMHDVVEDSDYTLEDIEANFGKKIAKIIDGLTKISVLNNQDLSIQSENYRKLLLTLSEDVRVILIKIADRLHNMRTLSSMAEHKQLKIASETIFIYAPLAHRLGLYKIKSELEDLSLKYNNPEAYDEIEKKLKETEDERNQYIKDFTGIISNKLDEEDFEYSIKGRPKSIFSIHRKMQKQKVSFEEVYDIFAIRIIYKANNKKDEKFIAWKIYSIITDIFRPNPSRLRDWITQPKSTGYESLHITVMGLMARWVEVQIRSARMDEIAEKGIAAHYKYKEGDAGNESNAELWVNQVREMLENQSQQDTVDFIDNFKLNFYNKEIYVFTPKGDLKSLPRGATALDFAFAIHSKVGETCLGAKTNGKLVPLSHELKSGDQVEIITSNQQKPKQSWLDFVTTARAKSKIKAALNAETKEVADNGKEIIIRKLRHLRINYTEKLAHEMASFFGEKTSRDFLYKVGLGLIDNKDIKRFAERQSGVYGFLKRFRKNTPQKKIDAPETEPTQNLDLLVFGPEEQRLDYNLAQCCNPIPGDKVFGFTTINKGVRVHKKDCPNAVDLRANYDYRVLNAKWIDSTKQEFSAIIEIVGIDRIGMINDITDVISASLHLNIKSLNISSNDGIFKGKISVSIANKTQLEKTINNLNKIEGITKVSRTYKA